MKILIVDDTLMMRTEMETIMGELGHEVVYMAKDGKDGVIAYEEYRPDLVTMDINMPEMNGINALKHIMEIDTNAKVIMVTTNGLESLVVRAIKAGALGYIVKPATVSKVKESIGKIFSEENDDDHMNELLKDI